MTYSNTHGRTTNSMDTYKSTSMLNTGSHGRWYMDHHHSHTSPFDWRQPSNLELISSRPLYNPVRTPTRLRALVAPPDLPSHPSTLKMHRFASPLPSVDWQAPPVSLDSWGLDPLDYYLNSNLNLLRRHPSPLSHFGLSYEPSTKEKKKKSYIVVPRLGNLVPSAMPKGLYTTVPPRWRTAVPLHLRDPQEGHLERNRLATPPKIRREPSDYLYLRQNETFADNYIDDFIGKCIENQFVPDILMEVVGELEEENQQAGGKSHQTDVDRYQAQLSNRIHQQPITDTDAVAEQWLRELEDQGRPLAASKIHYSLSVAEPLHYSESVPTHTADLVGYYPFHPDRQRRWLADLNEEIINVEAKNMLIELCAETLRESFHEAGRFPDTTRDLYPELRLAWLTENELGRGTPSVNHTRRYWVDLHAKNQLLDSLCLDRLVRKHIKHGSSLVDIDDFSRILDIALLNNLIHQYERIYVNRSRALDNYALRKFHFNNFMNIAMDLLLSELSASLIEDMKDLDEHALRPF